MKRTLVRGRNALLVGVVAAAMWPLGCGSSKTQPTPALPNLTTAPAGACNIDAVKMCQSAGGGSLSPASSNAATGGAPGSAAMPDSIDFQIPAGQTLRLMCYYDPQHKTIARADATPQSPLTTNSVEYLKTQGFCAR